MNPEDQINLALEILDNYLETKSNSALVKFWQLYPRPIPAWHLNMMNDKTRNDFYFQEIKNKAQDKIVMDIGSGSGLLTQFAIEAGAKHIYAIEMDPVLQRCFSHAFKKEIESGRVTLIAKNSKDLHLNDFIAGFPELIVHEIFGNTLFNEKVMETFSDLFNRKIIHPDMGFIPQKFSLCGCFHQQIFQSQISDPKYTDKFWFLENLSLFNNASKRDEGKDVGTSFNFFTVDLKDFNHKLESELNLEADDDGNFLRIWFELLGDKGSLSTDIKQNKDNHWGNSKYFLKFTKGKVRLKSSYSNGKFHAYVKK